MKVYSSRPSFLYPINFGSNTTPLPETATFEGDGDFRLYGTNFITSNSEAAKRLPDGLSVTGTVSFADSSIEVIGKNSTFGEIITRNSNVAVIMEGCSAKHADFSDSPDLQEVCDNFRFDTLRIGRTPAHFGTGKVGTLITADMTKEEFENCPNFKSIVYDRWLTESEARRVEQEPVGHERSDAARKRILDRKRETGVLYPRLDRCNL